MALVDRVLSIGHVQPDHCADKQRACMYILICGWIIAHALRKSNADCIQIGIVPRTLWPLILPLVRWVYMYVCQRLIILHSRTHACISLRAILMNTQNRIGSTTFALKY